MPRFSTGRVTEILSSRDGLQKVEVDGERAYVLTELIGSVQVGDEVVFNRTAVDLRLGTGGWHFVHWNLSQAPYDAAGPGHIMKLRYTSLQADTGAAEESLDLDGPISLAGTPVVVMPLHSLLGPLSVSLRHLRPGIRIAYVMTDAAALPIALSDLVADLVQHEVLNLTVTAGQAFGGDLEAVNAVSGVHVAAQRADIVLVGMGPGNVGTSSKLGFASLEVASLSDMTLSLGAEVTVCLRWSDLDTRSRHRGLSHHLVTAMKLASRTSTFAVPEGERAAEVLSALAGEGLSSRHKIVTCEAPDAVELLQARGMRVTSMGRPLAADPLFAQMAAAAATVAAGHLADR